MTAVAESAMIEAPHRLIAETRIEFKAVAMECLERVRSHEGTVLRIEMHSTVEVDASGLGTLVVVQKRAREQGLVTLLASAQPQVRSLLVATKLEGLFQFA